MFVRRLGLVALAALLPGCGLLSVGFSPWHRTQPMRASELSRKPPPFVVDSPTFRDEIATLTSDVRVGTRSGLANGELFLTGTESHDFWWPNALFIPLDFVFLVPDLLVGFPLFGADRS